MKTHYVHITKIGLRKTTAVDEQTHTEEVQTIPPSVTTLLVVGAVSQRDGTLKNIHTAQQPVCIVTIVSWDRSVGTVTGLGNKIFEVRISVGASNFFFYQNTQTGPGVNRGLTPV